MVHDKNCSTRKLVEQSVYHEPVSVFIHIFTLLALRLSFRLLVLILTMSELCHWLSIARMLPQNHCADEEDRCIWLSIAFLTSLYMYMYIYIYIYIWRLLTTLIMQSKTKFSGFIKAVIPVQYWLSWLFDV